MQVVMTVRIWTMDDEEVVMTRDRARRALRQMGNDFRIESCVESVAVHELLDDDEVAAYLKSLHSFWKAEDRVKTAERELRAGNPSRMEDYAAYLEGYRA